ncbi:MAG: MerR family DNA-binding transcriptional regulator [Gammaproteobacteria bacterium]|jgi:DNA-binding transcriptional MerR regulator
MTKTYSISELAEEFDITARTIRFYEDQALISPRREGTRRIYEERDRVRLKLILRAKRLGFTLSEIRETLDLYDTAPDGEVAQMKYVLDVIARHRATLLQQQDDILNVLQDMKNVEQRILDRMNTAEHES